VSGDEIWPADEVVVITEILFPAFWILGVFFVPAAVAPNAMKENLRPLSSRDFRAHKLP
jgi:hypothetical protein